MLLNSRSKSRGTCYNELLFSLCAEYIYHHHHRHQHDLGHEDADGAEEEE